MSDLQGSDPERIRSIADRTGAAYRPEEMEVTWDELAEAIRALKPFVERAGLWYTVVSERRITEDWIARMGHWVSV